MAIDDKLNLGGTPDQEKGPTRKIYDRFGVREAVTYHASSFTREVIRDVLPSWNLMPGKLFLDCYNLLGRSVSGAVAGIFNEVLRFGVIAAALNNDGIRESVINDPVSFTSAEIILAYAVFSNLIGDGITGRKKEVEKIYEPKI
ncbi:MAG TPA: hypothetical protein VJI98_00425 [Candidatus Nanoarchaeia archaeon]|nr:hypothetical protein [Candidatus Nanoarchaeia archaeon]